VRFGEARVAFESADFDHALALFEQALALGMEGPAIHFNIGVAAYRSADLARAERAFREVARTPAMAALAHYNLGLVALKRGDEREARDWFEHASRDPGDERLAALAAQRLDELPAASPPLTWSIYTRGGAGYDDNVALRSDSIDSTASGDDDAFVELLLAASLSFGNSWNVDAGAGLLNYLELDDFDQSAFSLGARRGFSAHEWGFEVGAFGSQLALGGDVFERSLSAGARANRHFIGGGMLQAHFRAATVDGEGDFSGLSGTRSELGVQYGWSWREWAMSTYARAENNDSQEEVFATRWMELGGSADWAMSPRWTLTAGAGWRRTRHPGDDTQDPWNDRRNTLRLGAIGKLWPSAQLFVRYEHERNSSPIDSYQYDRNWIAASLEWWR
jgi:tetratricopeptide (TPR) repeat protein